MMTEPSNHHVHEHHSNDQEMSFSERNRAHWDKHAATYNSDHTQKDFGDLINKVNAFILSNISWIGVDFLDPASAFERPVLGQTGRRVRVLDYACGPGTITNALIGYASEYIGIDLSEKMVEQYNLRFANQDQGEAQQPNAHAYSGDLLAASGPPEHLSGAEFYDFDLVVVGLGFHHFENLPEVTRRLIERLKSGGVLMIIDFLTHKHNDLDFENGTGNIIAHNGFSEQGIKDLFGSAGLTDIGMAVMDEQVLLRGKALRTVFIARGRKP